MRYLKELHALCVGKLFGHFLSHFVLFNAVDVDYVVVEDFEDGVFDEAHVHALSLGRHATKELRSFLDSFIIVLVDKNLGGSLNGNKAL